MFISDKFFKKFNKKPELTPASKDDEPQSTDSDTPMDEKSQKSFLEIIEDLAVRQKSNLPDNYAGQRTGLSIEKKSANPSEIKLTKSYKIDYQQELNSAQLETVTTINGAVLVIAGAGSGKTRVIAYRVAFMLENEINPGNDIILNAKNCMICYN
jgi:hypothetical protein